MTSAFGGLRSIQLSYECGVRADYLAERDRRRNEAKPTRAGYPASTDAGADP